ncbi:MAG: hypothetical protein COT73_04475 [Bdellovibrio sp. CG10_big_fil_rev_8_21_14_0_10_47_8]|nr:MAG: hypothetical protein COT73_04475 [Bdellovibrio sp. CG10_big_fil_rev_8_21_14_0_10_47_8]
MKIFFISILPFLFFSSHLFATALPAPGPDQANNHSACPLDQTSMGQELMSRSFLIVASHYCKQPEDQPEKLKTMTADYMTAQNPRYEILKKEAGAWLKKNSNKTACRSASERPRDIDEAFDGWWTKQHNLRSLAAGRNAREYCQQALNLLERSQTPPFLTDARPVTEPAPAKTEPIVRNTMEKINTNLERLKPPAQPTKLSQDPSPSITTPPPASTYSGSLYRESRSSSNYDIYLPSMETLTFQRPGMMLQPCSMCYFIPVNALGFSPSWLAPMGPPIQPLNSGSR